MTSFLQQIFFKKITLLSIITHSLSLEELFFRNPEKLLLVENEIENSNSTITTKTATGGVLQERCFKNLCNIKEKKLVLESLLNFQA